MTQEENTQVDINITDLAIGAGTIMAVANTGTGVWAIAGIVSYYGYRWFFNLKPIREWIDRVRVKVPPTDIILPYLLPAPKDDDNQPLMLGKNGMIDQRVMTNIDPYEGMSLWQRARQKPVTAQNTVTSTMLPSNNEMVLKKQGAAEQQQLAFAKKAFKTLPSYFSHDALPEPPSKLAVPIGINYQQQVIWGDFSAQVNDHDTSRLLHVLVTGKTSSGKDSLIRLWYKMLTEHNTPAEVQFVIIDGKMDWLSPQVGNSPYMAIPPAGGTDFKKKEGKRIDCGAERMAESVDWVFEEIDRRNRIIVAAGAVDLVSYTRRTGKSMPYLFIMAMDVGEQLNDDLGKLIKQLIMKGRSYGVRLIINMQNPVGEDTKWRSQIGAVITGHQQDPNHDNKILHIPVSRMVIRPSQLPDPEEYDAAKGLFILRQGSKQELLRAPHLPNEDWEDYLDDLSARFIPARSHKDDFLADLLEHADDFVKKPVKKVIIPQNVLTKEQIKRIVQLTRAGVNKTDIMVDHLKFTGNYNEKKDAVQMVIDIAKGKLRQ